MLKSAILKSYSGKNKNASLLGIKAPSYNSFSEEWEGANVLSEMINRRSTETIIFPKDEKYGEKYPRFVKILKQLYNYVYNNDNVFKWLSHYSGYTPTEVLEQLKYGQGVLIIAKDNTAEYGETPHSATDIKVNLKWVRGLEMAKLNETIQGTSFLIVATILHEFVHYGRSKNKLDRVYEYGWGFEREAFGEIVDKDNANSLYQKNGWSFKK